MTKKFFSYSYFETPMWKQEFPEFVKTTNKVCNKYIKQATDKNKEQIEKRNKEYGRNLKDVGLSHQSTPIHQEPQLQELVKLCGEASLSFLNWTGVDTDKITLYFTEFWVQEFGSLAGHHDTHVHWNNHVSGFYFLKASKTSSCPLFHEPKAGALMTKLPEKDLSKITPASHTLHHSVKPGTLIIFPSYLPHQFKVDVSGSPFRFIHWNMKAIINEENKIMTKARDLRYKGKE